MDGDIEAFLAADPAALSHDARLSRLSALAVLESQVAAAKIRTLAMIAVDPPLRSEQEVLFRDKQYVREEVACLLRIAPATARQKLAEAVDLCHELEPTVQLVETGAISAVHAKILWEHTRDVGQEIRSEVEARVLGKAPAQTFSEFRQAVKRAVLSLDKRDRQQKRKDAAQQIGVWAKDEDDGMASMFVFATAEDVASAMTSLEAKVARTKVMNRRAAGAGNDPDQRSDGQRLVDALVEMCLTDLANNDTRQQGRKPTIQVSVAWSTVFGDDDEPCELAGYGPISAEHARALAADASSSWRWIMHDRTGQVIDISTDTYRPPAGLRDFILARDRTCRMAGCRKQAHHCELDHIEDWAKGGTTSPTNNDGKCLRHHHLKTEAGWTVTRQPDGATIWITPTGRHYDKPPDWIPLDTTNKPKPAPPPAPPPRNDPPPF